MEKFPTKKSNPLLFALEDNEKACCRTFLGNFQQSLLGDQLRLHGRFELYNLKMDPWLYIDAYLPSLSEILSPPNSGHLKTTKQKIYIYIYNINPKQIHSTRCISSNSKSSSSGTEVVDLKDTWPISSTHSTFRALMTFYNFPIAKMSWKTAVIMAMFNNYLTKTVSQFFWL